MEAREPDFTHAIFLYYCPRCLAHVNTILWVTWQSGQQQKKKYNLKKGFIYDMDKRDFSGGKITIKNKSRLMNLMSTKTVSGKDTC